MNPYKVSGSRSPPMKKARNELTPKSKKNEILEDFDKSVMEEMAPQITTFIYQGEEYVQLPKKLYVAEKEALVIQIRKYKAFFDKLKASINSFD